jgi:hypothetical protein
MNQSLHLVTGLWGANDESGPKRLKTYQCRYRRPKMWILKRLVCLMHDHILIDAGWKGLKYRYCLRCSKVMQPVKVSLKGL